MLFIRFLTLSFLLTFTVSYKLFISLKTTASRLSYLSHSLIHYFIFEELFKLRNLLKSRSNRPCTSWVVQRTKHPLSGSSYCYLEIHFRLYYYVNALACVQAVTFSGFLAK